MLVAKKLIWGPLQALEDEEEDTSLEEIDLVYEDSEDVEPEEEEECEEDEV